MPIEVVYCGSKLSYNLLYKYHTIVCDLPPEYCMVDKKDSSECKNWLKNNHLTLYEKIYPEVEGAEGEEEKKEEENKGGQ